MFPVSPTPSRLPPASSLCCLVYSSPSSTPKPTAPGCFPLCNHSFLPLLAQAAQLPKARPSCLPSCPSPFATSHPVGPGKRQEIRGWLGACCSEHLVIPMTLVCQGGTQASVYPDPRDQGREPCFLLLPLFVMVTILELALRSRLLRVCGTGLVSRLRTVSAGGID